MYRLGIWRKNTLEKNSFTCTIIDITCTSSMFLYHKYERQLKLTKHMTKTSNMKEKDENLKKQKNIRPSKNRSKSKKQR